MRKLISHPALIVLLFVIIACEKEEGSNRVQTDQLEAIIMSNPEITPNGNVFSLNVIQPNGTYRWRKVQWGFISGVALDSSLLYVFGSAPDYSKGKFAVYDINTGAEKWAKIIQDEFWREPIIRNDTMFCSISNTVTQTLSDGYIAAVNAQTGTLYWKKKVVDIFEPRNLVLEGRNIYFIIAEAPAGSGGKLISFNLDSQTINWSLQLAPTGGFVGGGPLYDFGNKLAVKGYVPNSFNLSVVNKSNGAIAGTFTTQIRGHENSLIVNNTFVGHNGNGLYAYDLITGTQKWGVPIPGLGGIPEAMISSSDDEIILTGVDITGYYIKGFSVSNGTLLWTKRPPALFYSIDAPIVLGDKVYTHNVISNGSGQTSFRGIYSYNTSDGSLVDSVRLTNGEKYPYYLVGSSGKLYSFAY